VEEALAQFRRLRQEGPQDVPRHRGVRDNVMFREG
jgi:hypothetical protein